MDVRDADISGQMTGTGCIIIRPSVPHVLAPLAIGSRKRRGYSLSLPVLEEIHGKTIEPPLNLPTTLSCFDEVPDRGEWKATGRMNLALVVSKAKLELFQVCKSERK
jgi:hypothetical protein